VTDSLRLLHTNVWIALARGEPGPVARLRSLDPANVASCSIVLAELKFAARKSQRVSENLEGFRRLLEPFASLPFDDFAAGHYGIIRATQERAGALGSSDLLIAAIALAHDCLLVTRNSREFERIVGLRLETWP
jgi:tRNA(fMet)-specific endonuclease VapC